MSTAPMSMPNSRLDVATTADSSPDFSASSTSSRSSRDMEPWCARAKTDGDPALTADCAMIFAGVERPGRGVCPASSLMRAHRRSAMSRELAKTIVDRLAVITSTSRRVIDGQTEGCPVSSTSSIFARSGTVTSTFTSSVFSAGGRTTVTGRSPPRKAAVASTGRTVADNPMRCAGDGSSASNRSSDNARCAPRLVAATAWTSSTMTASTPLNASRALDVNSR